MDQAHLLAEGLTPWAGRKWSVMCISNVYFSILLSLLSVHGCPLDISEVYFIMVDLTVTSRDHVAMKEGVSGQKGVQNEG